MQRSRHVLSVASPFERGLQQSLSGITELAEPASRNEDTRSELKRNE